MSCSICRDIKVNHVSEGYTVKCANCGSVMKEKKMKIKQKKGTFMPITITLQTREEAEALLDFVENHYCKEDVGSKERSLAIEISDTLHELYI